jgi:hypothetical protein
MTEYSASYLDAAERAAVRATSFNVKLTAEDTRIYELVNPV